MQGGSLPDRITPDAILEALVEFRFDHTELSELVIGRLLDAELWEGYRQSRLPTADIPQPIRELDANLRYQPTFELRRDDGSRVAKIGGNVLSYHVTGPYPGWDVFEREIRTILDSLMNKLRSYQIIRIGLRYINILRPEKHHVKGLEDTNIMLRVGEDELQKSIAVNYTRSSEPGHTVMVRVATPDLVTGQVEPGFALLCDIDVSTTAEVNMGSLNEVIGWIDRAHSLEKAEFFALIPDRITQLLVAKAKGDQGG